MRVNNQTTFVDAILSLARESGLSRSKTKIIRFLLKQESSRTCKEIADGSNVPETKIYHLLKALESEGIVQSIQEWPKQYKLRDHETVIMKIKEQGLSKFSGERRRLEEKISELGRLAGELQKIVRGQPPRGIFASVINPTEPSETSIIAIYSKFISNGTRMEKEYRALLPHTILQFPDNWIRYELRRKWKHLHVKKISQGVVAKYICYLGGVERQLKNGGKSAERAVTMLKELSENLKLENLHLALADQPPYGGILIWDNWGAFLLTPRISEDPYREGISIEGTAGVKILKEQFDIYFGRVLEANLMDFLQMKDQEVGKLTYEDAKNRISRMSSREKLMNLKAYTMQEINRILEG